MKEVIKNEAIASLKSNLGLRLDLLESELEVELDTKDSLSSD
jgi:hypothetical protein